MFKNQNIILYYLLLEVSANKALTMQSRQQAGKLNEVELNLSSNPIEKVDAEKITLLEKNLNSLESNNKQLKQLICTIYKKYEVTFNLITWDLNNFYFQNLFFSFLLKFYL